jgi:tetratricopeptide (TPR) repeat protein
MGKVSRICTRIALVVGLLLVVSAAPAAAQGGKSEDVAEARTRYKKGLDLYEDGAFDAALIEFQRAYDLAPSYKILYNIGLVQLQLNDFSGALRSFRRYLDDGGKKIDQKRRGEVEKEIKKLEGRVASLELKSNVDGAEILVDDLEVGETPLDAPLLVNAGKRKITLSKSGYVPTTRVVVVAGGDSKTLELELRPGQGSAPTPLETKPSKADTATKRAPGKPVAAGPTRKVPWLAWGITGGLAVGTTVAGVLTLGAQKDLDDKKNQPSSKQALDDAAGKTRTFAIVTDVLLVGTVAVGGYATYLTFFKKPDDARADQSAVWLSVGPGRVDVAGSF